MTTPPNRRPGKAAVFAGLLALFGLGCLADWYVAIPEEAVAGYVGRERCISCHQQEASDWAGSHHDRAMELATDDTVLGDFDNAEFTRLGVTTRFYRKGAEYWVRTEGPDGEMHDYRVDYTFGVDPLQQYMVELEGGRVQVLRVSWDTVRNEWFYVPPPDAVDERLEPDDPLHWTGLAQNWNTMCAECHSTNLQKNFTLASNTYDTTYSEIDVSCEACHGPGSLHAELAESRSLFWDRRRGYALSGLKNASNRKQLEACAPCHSRRTAIHGDWHAGNRFFDHFAPSLLEPGLYHADGQILDEVYVYGSFLQSKMYHENVKCTDCHNPHSLKLKFEGNQLCAQCHQPGKYDGAGHHHHAGAGEAAQQCVNCHMPERHYMVVDGRRDHSFRVPRPDLSVELGTPNACNDCHTKPEEDAAWAAEAVREWYGDKRPDDPHYAPALAAGWEGKPEAVEMLREVLRRDYPEIVHATAVRALGRIADAEAQKLCREAVDERSPLVRATALRAAAERSIDEMALESAWHLRDSARLVRFAAASRLVERAPQLQGTEHEPILQEALEEYQTGQEVILDRAGTNMQRAAL
ncbi:MAG: HEAT repeat domain-containing protein [Planctomycetota bacterium]